MKGECQGMWGINKLQYKIAQCIRRTALKNGIMPQLLELWMCFLLKVAVVTYCARNCFSSSSLLVIDTAHNSQI